MIIIHKTYNTTWSQKYVCWCFSNENQNSKIQTEILEKLKNICLNIFPTYFMLIVIIIDIIFMFNQMWKGVKSVVLGKQVKIIVNIWGSIYVYMIWQFLSGLNGAWWYRLIWWDGGIFQYICFIVLFIDLK